MYTFVTGGFRSGRSNYALRRASELGHPPWLYVASAQEADESVQKRVAPHRRDSEAIWRTGVLPPHLPALVDGGALEGYGAAVFDGIAGWIEQQLKAADADRAILDQISTLADRMYRMPIPIVVVSTEMGMGLPPRDAAEQRLLKVVSQANQILIQAAGSVVLMVGGMPFKP